jgi:hypothetical protein
MRAAGLSLALLGSCATLASQGGGDLGLPSSGAGPFQALGPMQLASQDIPPFVLSRPGAACTEPAVLSESAGGSTPAVSMYYVLPGASGSQIALSRADDGVSFYGDSGDVEVHPTHRPPAVLTATLPWEGAGVAGPSALRVGSEVWLYYAAAGGIGLAKSGDGRAFTKTGAPVIARDPSVQWESSELRAPSVAVFPDGRWHMLYASGGSIGEATSADGEAWTRADGDPSTPALDPVLAPSKTVEPSTLPAGEHPPFDEGGVDDPLLAPRVDPTGRLQVRVFYTGYAPSPDASTPAGSIGFAARYGVTGALSRQAAPVYFAPGSTVAGPALLEWQGPSILYASQPDTKLSPPIAGIAGAFDPGAGSPPPVGSFPSSP